MTPPKVTCRQCGHNAHSESLGCPSCLPGTGCGPEPELPEDWPRIIGDGPAYDMRDFTLGPEEFICAECRLVHRRNQECP
ncbi:hypothetical protein FDI63_gp081 [Mycobacterium phage ChrisnMich]|uniref:Uncharacterized protein n=1 Tax=Mycobacterium phage ChrisnMich TaxID=1034130 RepID=G1BLD8_9CAUD|nr:hypothetical protein FDI63_gp081 [Mycobacterium phage ChrisnMich]AEJ94662.1 hypothetical protein CHRISNMICH_81 [Mycobacterium phage ChrisnMich]